MYVNIMYIVDCKCFPVMIFKLSEKNISKIHMHFQAGKMTIVIKESYYPHDL